MFDLIYITTLIMWVNENQNNEFSIHCNVLMLNINYQVIFYSDHDNLEPHLINELHEL